MRSECGSDSRDGGRESRPREHGEEGRKGLQEGVVEVLLRSAASCLAPQFGYRRMLTQENKDLRVAQWHLCVKVQLECSDVCPFEPLTLEGTRHCCTFL